MKRRPRRPHNPTMPTLAQAEKALGEPASKWVARCYEIACAIVDAKIVPAGSTAVYGHWRGPIAPGTTFDRGTPLPFCQHGWVLLPDGGVLDPTRWVFEGREPYLYIGPADYYDEGGNTWREALMEPAPDFDPSARSYEILLPPAALSFVESLFPFNPNRPLPRDVRKGVVLGARQLSWLANKSPQTLGPHVLPVFQAICAVGQSAFIPIDNLRRVERENRVELDR